MKPDKERSSNNTNGGVGNQIKINKNTEETRGRVIRYMQSPHPVLV